MSENQLSDPRRVEESSYLPFLDSGAAWVAEDDAGLTGFAILDTATNSVWALFVAPESESRGVGKALHDCMLRWARDQGVQRLFLTTQAGTRAEHFYRRHGWTGMSRTEDGEIRFELSV